MNDRLISLLLILGLMSLGSTTGCKKPSSQELESMFNQAQELQMANKHEEAIKVYREIIKKAPNSKMGANSQFMIGFIFNNYLRDTAQARIELTRFLEKYSKIADSGLVAGAKFELEYLGKDISEIPILSQLEPEPTPVDTTTLDYIIEKKEKERKERTGEKE